MKIISILVVYYTRELYIATVSNHIGITGPVLAEGSSVACLANFFAYSSSSSGLRPFDL